MLGFTPGFPYLGGMRETIATPRLEKPRSKIEAGSVGIAGSQTGIYPIESPGGWQLIGKTPLKLFNSEKEKPFLLESGNYLKFVPIDEEEFNVIKKSIEDNNYQIKTYCKDVD
jgi:KipI family sensor histidine kinase inhibitor